MHVFASGPSLFDFYFIFTLTLNFIFLKQMDAHYLIIWAPSIG